MLRSALTMDDLASGAAALCSAALAGRLLDVQACRAAAPPFADIGIISCASEDSAEAALGLHLGDVLAVSPDADASHFSDALWFAAANPADLSAVWHDPFYGGRGSTPTDVTQWSKGTIHHPVE